MQVVLQRVSEASVTIGGRVGGEIGRGLLVLFCAERGDETAQADYFARKTATMRIFPDENGKMNRSLMDIGGAALVISQFTLAARWRKGNRPSFINSAAPELGEALYDRFCAQLGDHGPPVQTGIFGAEMQVRLVNDGPVTIVMDSKD